MSSACQPLPTAPQDHATRGIAFALSAFFFFSLMDGIAKYLGEAFHVVQLIFFRSLFGFLPLIPLIRRDGGRQGLKTRRPFLHLVRGFAVCAALATFFLGIQLLPLAEALTLAFTSPLFMTLLSIPVLRERVGVHRLAAVLVGFCGVLIIVRPGAEAFRPEGLYMIVSGFCFAMASVLTRLLGRTETNAAITFYSTCAQFVPSALLLPFFWIAPTETLQWGLFVMLGLLGGIGLQLMTNAFRRAPASVIAPFEYTALIWATAIGWIGWREWPGDHVWLGAAVLVATGLYITYREARHGRAGAGAH